MPISEYSSRGSLIQACCYPFLQFALSCYSSSVLLSRKQTCTMPFHNIIMLHNATAENKNAGTVYAICRKQRRRYAPKPKSKGHRRRSALIEKRYKGKQNTCVGQATHSNHTLLAPSKLKLIAVSFAALLPWSGSISHRLTWNGTGALKLFACCMDPIPAPGVAALGPDPILCIAAACCGVCGRGLCCGNRLCGCGAPKRAAGDCA